MLIAAEVERLWKTAPQRPRHPPFGDQPVERLSGCRRRTELGDRPVAIGHHQALAALHSAQVLAEVLAQLCDADSCHVHEGSSSRTHGSFERECAPATPWVPMQMSPSGR
jgi:hypothetical protein